MTKCCAAPAETRSDNHLLVTSAVTTTAMGPPMGPPGPPSAIHGLSTATTFPNASAEAALAPLVAAHGLNEAEQATRLVVRRWAEEKLAPAAAAHWEAATFPHELMPSFRALGIGGGAVYGDASVRRLSAKAVAMIGAELSRVDASFATMYLVHTGLAMVRPVTPRQPPPPANSSTNAAVAGYLPAGPAHALAPPRPRPRRASGSAPRPSSARASCRAWPRWS